MKKLNYEQALRYLCGDTTVGDTRPGEDRKDEARDVITDAVWALVTEEGDGKGELRDWIATGDWSPTELNRLSAWTAQTLAADWDTMQRIAQDL